MLEDERVVMTAGEHSMAGQDCVPSFESGRVDLGSCGTDVKIMAVVITAVVT